MAGLFTVKVDVSDADVILKRLGFARGGKVQEFFTNELMRRSAPYMPFRDGMLLASARMAEDYTAIDYIAPDSRYLWYGKLMVDPITGKGAFFSPTYGFWSRPNTKKVLTNRDLHYNGAPMRGARWVERCWIDNKDSIIAATEQYAERYAK